MKKRIREYIRISLAAVLAAALCLSGCQKKQDTAAPADSVTETEAAAEPETEPAIEPAAEAEAEPAAETRAENAADEDALFGAPWINTMVEGNLPEYAPEAADDLYASYNYDLLEEHQGEYYTYMESAVDEIQETVLTALRDEDRAELSEMRLFYEQASDLEKLKEIGFSEVQPYIDRIDKVTSIEEMDDLLTAEDFPFSPFVTAYLGVADIRGDYIVSVYPNYMFFDAITEGSDYYIDADDPDGQQTNETIIQSAAHRALLDYSLLGLTMDQALDAIPELIRFEKSYGKYGDSNIESTKADYGAGAEVFAARLYAPEELTAHCPNIPMKGMLEKLGKDGADEYCVYSAQWVSALNDLWTAENLDTIKLAVKVKILNETRPYRYHAEVDKAYGIATDPETYGFEACQSLDTFGQVMADIYVKDAIGQKGKTRLESLARNLVDAYGNLVRETPWLNDSSREKINEKLEHMTLNILEPESGYFDYSSLKLVPYEEGGTLLSNYLLLKQYRYDREKERIGTPANGDIVWFSVSPLHFNAYYDFDTNSINICPGFVTSTVYRESMSEEELMGSMGFVIGHEISHGFDYLGSQVDAYGHPGSLFFEDDLEEFTEKCAKLANYYNTMQIFPDRYVDGQTVKKEAVADLAGMQACISVLGKEENADYDAFFRSAATTWAQEGPEDYLMLYVGSGHPLSYLRVNVNAQMFEPFYEVYDVSEGDGMYLAPEERITIWGSAS